MLYTKPPLVLEQQADLLISRGLEAEKSQLIAFLRHVNYYRVTGYLFPFRNSDNSYCSNISFATFKRLYFYDQSLRNLMLSAIDRIEVSLRTVIAYHFSRCCGPFGYAEHRNLPGIDMEIHQKLIIRIKEETIRSREEFIKHFKNKYGDQHEILPIWMAVEIISFGTLVSFYRGLPNNLKQEIAREYKIPDAVLSSWIIGLNAIRNVCAHHSRFFNRRLGYQFKLPNRRKFPQWYSPIAIPNGRTFTGLTICGFLLDLIDTDSSWKKLVKELFLEYKDISAIKESFPEEWQTSPLWIEGGDSI